jgi:hypothetical protein
LGVAGGNSKDKAGVVLWGRNDHKDQVWKFNSDDELESECTECVLDIVGKNGKNGAHVNMYHKTGAWNQKWKKVAFRTLKT